MRILFIHSAKVKGVYYTFPQTLEISSAIGIALIDQGIAIVVSVAGVLDEFEVVPFTTTATPTITNYNTAYSLKYGQYPDISCWQVDGDTKWKLQATAIFTTVGGLIDTISFDLGFEVSGFIIIR